MKFVPSVKYYGTKHRVLVLTFMEIKNPHKEVSGNFSRCGSYSNYFKTTNVCLFLSPSSIYCKLRFPNFKTFIRFNTNYPSSENYLFPNFSNFNFHLILDLFHHIAKSKRIIVHINPNYSSNPSFKLFHLILKLFYNTKLSTSNLSFL